MEDQRPYIRGPYKQRSPYTWADKALMMATLLLILVVALLVHQEVKHVP